MNYQDFTVIIVLMVFLMVMKNKLTAGEVVHHVVTEKSTHHTHKTLLKSYFLRCLGGCDNNLAQS